MKKLDKLAKVKGYVIHCPTFSDANRLCTALNIAGYVWRDGGTYASYNYWNQHKEQTCYNPYEGTYARRYYFENEAEKNCGYKINIINIDEFLDILNS